MQSQTEVWRSRVSSSLGIVLGAAVAAAAVAWTGTAEAQTKTLKMQSTWPASLTLQDNFKFFGERVEKLTGGTLKIETLAAGQIVPPFEILDATSKKVIDGGHGISYYWVGKNKAATLFSNTPAGIVGMDQMDFLGWIYEAGGLEMWWDFYQKDLKLNVVAFPILPASPQALGWFRKPIQSVEDFKGMKCRQTGIVGEIYKKHGHEHGQHARRRDRAFGRARRDRLRRVGRRRRGPAPRPAAGVEVPLHAGHARERLDRRADHQQGGLGRPHPAAAGGDPLGDDRDPRALVGEMAEAERRCHRGDADQARHADPAHPAGDPDRVLQGVGRDRQRGDGRQPDLQEDLRVRRRPTRPRSCRPSASCSRPTRSRRTTTSRRSRASDPRNWQEIEGRLRVAAAPFQFSKGGDGAR